MSTIDTDIVTDDTSENPAPLGWRSEDWLAVILGLTLLLSAFLCAWSTVEGSGTHPWKPWVGKPGSWESNPLRSLSSEGMLFDKLQSLLGPFLVALCGFGLAVRLQRKSFVQFLVAFPVLFSLGTLAYVLAGQVTIKHFNLEYALWALPSDC